MAKQLSLIALALALTGCATMPARADGDAELAEVIKGKVAEAPQACINLRNANGSRVLRDAIVFRESRRLVYVSKTPGCRTASLDPILVLEPFGSRLCRGDLVRLVDRGSNFPGTGCALGEFTPYRAPR